MDGSWATIETPNVPGVLHGGAPGASRYLFFRVGDMSAALDRVRELGGTNGDYVSGDDPATVAKSGRPPNAF
ncbi:MAG: hypothetical protein M3400_17205 [Actinomycetota bacterium]|nr:hypothetical protein [Actinomycetota bacterium]